MIHPSQSQQSFEYIVHNKYLTKKYFCQQFINTIFSYYVLCHLLKSRPQRHKGGSSPFSSEEGKGPPFLLTGSDPGSR